MTTHVRRRYWIESAAAVLAFVLLLVTLVSREWIEIVFGVDPDGGSGALEWAIVAGLAVVGLVSALVARHEVVRARRSESAIAA
jgi:hypothetical protein